jgi:predicted nucleotidyltransferase
VRDAVRRLIPGAKVLLYGSVARGTQHGDSDYDVLILTDTKLGYPDRKPLREEVYELELELGIQVSLLYCSRAEWDSVIARGSPFRAEVEKDGIAL